MGSENEDVVDVVGNNIEDLLDSALQMGEQLAGSVHPVREVTKSLSESSSESSDQEKNLGELLAKRNEALQGGRYHDARHKHQAIIRYSTQTTAICDSRTPPLADFPGTSAPISISASTGMEALDVLSAYPWLPSKPRVSARTQLLYAMAYFHVEAYMLGKEVCHDLQSLIMDPFDCKFVDIIRELAWAWSTDDSWYYASRSFGPVEAWFARLLDRCWRLLGMLEEDWQSSEEVGLGEEVEDKYFEDANDLAISMMKHREELWIDEGAAVRDGSMDLYCCFKSMLGNLVKLPREVRDKIYDQLLLSRYTFNADAGDRRPYKIHLAMLQVSKQISAEMTQVLYKDNRFIVLNLKGEADRYFAWFDKVPTFERLVPVNVVDAALEINISGINVDQDSLETLRTFVFFPESLDTVLESLWEFIIRAWDVNNVEPSLLLKISLVLHPVLLSRRGMVQKDLLRPFERLVGFGEVEIHGCADKEFHHNILNRMKLFPSTENLQEGLQYYLAVGKEAYQQKRYNEATHHWMLAKKYHGSLAAAARRRISADGESCAEPLLAALTNSAPMLHIAKLGILKAGLRREDYLFVLGQFFTWEAEDEELSPLLRAQVQLAASMAFHGRFIFDLGQKSFDKAQDTIVLEAVPYMGELLTIVMRMSWAEQWLFSNSSYSFFFAWKQCWELLEVEDKGCLNEDGERKDIDYGEGRYTEYSGSEGTSDGEGEWTTTDEESFEDVQDSTEEGSVW
ncbi:hypothetical protein MMC11_005959 [Xylographa trunciseda]|nr:hypothetical protein [Xylographa trunciseda]